MEQTMMREAVFDQYIREGQSLREAAFDRCVGEGPSLREAAFAIALRGTDTKTTASLSCVSKDLADKLSEYDLWRLKFNSEFNSTWYQEQWTAKDNYKLQKKGGVMKLAVAKPDTSTVDFVLYVPCLRRERLASLIDLDCLRGELSSFSMTALDFRQPLARYVLFQSVGFDDFVYKSSFTTRKEAAAQIHEICSTKKFEYDTFVLVDITTLVLEFSIPKNIDEEGMKELENKAKPAFWFCNPYNAHDVLWPLRDVEAELDCLQELDEKQ